jgi:iron transport multicopper oxidase
VVNLAIDPATGKLTTQDYFQPYDYQNMDGGDQDFGSSGVTLLDPTIFKGTGVNRIAVGSGKNGKIYFMNADNLGGYKQGSGGSDGIIQTINTQKAVFWLIPSRRRISVFDAGRIRHLCLSAWI